MPFMQECVQQHGGPKEILKKSQQQLQLPRMQV